MIYKILVGNEHGGAAVASTEVINNFIDGENFAVVFLCNGEFSRKFDKSRPNVFSINSFEPPILAADSFVKKLVNYFRFVLWILFTVFKFLHFTKKQNIECIHTTNNHALLVTLLTKYFRKSIYVVSHWRCVGLASAGKYNKILYQIDKVICISRAVKRSLPPFMQLKSIIIYDGIDVGSISSEGIKLRGHLRRRMNFSNEDFVIGTIGSYTSIKCHDLLIDTIAILPTKDLKLILFGSCPNRESEKYLRVLKNKVLSLGLQDRVFFLMDPDYQVPRNYIIDFDVFIGATWNSGLGEGFGLIYLEAMSQKLPVIAIDVGAAKEIIVDRETGWLIERNNPEELAEVLLECWKNRQELNAYGENGYNRARSEFDIQITVDKLKILYTETCG